MVAFKSCFLLLVDDVHGLCREPRATHGSFDGNIVTLIRFVLLVLLFNFVMHCIISTAVVAFEMNYLMLI